MKRVLIALAMATAIFLTSALAAQSSTSEKVIKDPAEYNAYMSALNLTDPTSKAAAFENFAREYPASLVKYDALKQAMAAYQAAGDLGGVDRMASALLQVEPDNIRALGLHVFVLRARGTPADAALVLTSCVKGLDLLGSWKKPEDVTDDQFQAMRNQLAAIFDGACGYSKLQSKDYAMASRYFMNSLAVDPKNLQDTYQLSVALLQMTPPEPLGLWYAAKAIDLATGNAPAQKSIGDYGRAKYVKIHGSADGWDKLLAQAAGETAPPSGFHVAPPPTEAELAVKAVAENDPGTLSIGDWETVLSYRDTSQANHDAADKVWTTIQAKQKNGLARLKLPVMVISATTTTIEAAITEDNQKAKRADLVVTLQKPMQHPPQAGAMISILGVISNYTPQPFQFVMIEGAVAAPPK